MEYLDITEGQYKTLQMALEANNPSSLDVHTNLANGEGMSIGELLADPTSELTLDNLDLQLATAQIEAALGSEEVEMLQLQAKGFTQLGIAKALRTSKTTVNYRLGVARARARALLPELEDLLAA